MDLIVTTLALAAVTLLVFRLLRVGRRPPDLPPGPPTIPILGNIHLMPDRDVHLQFQKWAQEYGPVYSLIAGTQTTIVLSSAEAVKDLLDKRSAIYSDRLVHYLGGTILSGGNRMLMMHYGPQWRMIRKMYHSALNVNKSVTYVPYQDLENKQMLFELLTQPDRFLDSVRRYTMSVTTSITYGFRTITFDDPRQAELFHNTETLMQLVQSPTAALLDVFPLLRWLPDFLLPGQKLAREQHRRESKLFMSLWLNVKNAVRSGTAKPCYCVDQAEMQLKEGFSDELAAYNAGCILEAGSDVSIAQDRNNLPRCGGSLCGDCFIASKFEIFCRCEPPANLVIRRSQTTSNTLYAWIQAMLLFPGVQKKAQEQIDQVVGTEHFPEMDDYAQLPYIRSCIKESTRWMPTAPLGFPHAVMEDDEYLGYRIPKGAGIINNIYTIHMDSSRHCEPRKFDPDRYKDDAQSLVEAATNPEPEKRGTLAFGAGRRICSGMHVAERSLFLAMARILWAFDIVPAKDENGEDILPDPSKLTQAVVCMPEPFQATMKPRSAEKAALIRKSWRDAQNDLDPETKQWK